MGYPGSFLFAPSPTRTAINLQSQSYYKAGPMHTTTEPAAAGTAAAAQPATAAAAANLEPAAAVAQAMETEATEPVPEFKERGLWLGSLPATADTNALKALFIPYGGAATLKPGRGFALLDLPSAAAEAAALAAFAAAPASAFMLGELPLTLRRQREWTDAENVKHDQRHADRLKRKADKRAAKRQRLNKSRLCRACPPVHKWSHSDD